eukprot:gene6775-9279_t
MDEPVVIEKILKILVVGNAKCGKTSIIGQYTNKIFENSYKSTVGADFARKDIKLQLSMNEYIGIRVQLWDIAGQDRFQKLTRAYFSGARGVVIVCDISREGTVEAVRNWKLEIDAWADQSGCPDIPVVLFANKSDLLRNPQDSLKTGVTMERMCREQGILGWWTTSALTGESLEEGFNSLYLKILEQEFEVAQSISDIGNLDSSTVKSPTFQLADNSKRSHNYDDYTDSIPITLC